MTLMVNLRVTKPERAIIVHVVRLYVLKQLALIILYQLNIHFLRVSTRRQVQLRHDHCI